MTSIKLYNELDLVVKHFYEKLKLNKQEKTKGRKLAISNIKTLTLGVFKNFCGIPTKKKVYQIFNLKCSYKTFVVNINRCSVLALYIFALIMKANRQNCHIVKITDSTDIPVCQNKNAKNHKTMQGFANWAKTGKGWYFGLKMSLTVDLEGKILGAKLTSGNVSDSVVFMDLNKDLSGLFVADSAYISKELAEIFHKKTGGFLFAKPRSNMRKLITDFQFHLYNTRMKIEVNFRNLKSFFGFISTLPRSINGFFANCIYSLLAYQFA